MVQQYNKTIERARRQFLGYRQRFEETVEEAVTSLREYCVSGLEELSRRDYRGRLYLWGGKLPTDHYWWELKDGKMYSVVRNSGGIEYREVNLALLDDEGRRFHNHLLSKVKTSQLKRAATKIESALKSLPA